MTVAALEQGMPVRFSSVVLLTKREAFDACAACAEAERALVRSGRAVEAGRMGALFELLEARLVAEAAVLQSSTTRPR